MLTIYLFIYFLFVVVSGLKEDGVCLFLGKIVKVVVQLIPLYFVADELMRNSYWILHHVDI